MQVSYLKLCSPPFRAASYQDAFPSYARSQSVRHFGVRWTDKVGPTLSPDGRLAEP